MSTDEAKAKLLAVASVCFGLAYVNIGVDHFTDTSWFEPIVPEVLGNPAFWVLLTGAMEIAIGVGLIVPALRRRAGMASAVFLVGVYWANLNMWANNIPLDGKTFPDHLHALRLLAQIGMIVLSIAILRTASPTR